MTKTQQIQDAIMALKVQLAGKRLELAVLRGKRRNAQHHKNQMYAAIRARQVFRMDMAERADACFFDAAGEADRLVLGGASNA